MSFFLRQPIIFIFFLGFFLNSNTFAANDSAVKVKWGYKGNIGPEKWGILDKEFELCLKGKSQSPINIIQKKLVPTESELQINYSNAPLDILYDGTTQLLIGDTQTVINDGHTVQVNFHENTHESINYLGKEYRLLQFHIHTPSENQWKGVSYPLEIHFVHQGADGKIVVIGVFAAGAGKDNKDLQKLVKNIPINKGEDYLVPNEYINPAALMPINQDYAHFTGSLTTPPCSEGIEWIVMESTITVSPAQMAILRKAAGGGNARPVQPLNGRIVYYSSKKKI